MVKAELVHNPYLLETDIKFNGQPPRINSLVEKYQSRILQDWIKLLPGIFHGEMNGYDFELEFSGTSRDYDELVRAFQQAGVSENQVKLFHKNELEGREEKRKRIKDLLKWLEDNPNRNFDNNQFRQENEILFDGAYTFISFQADETEQPQIEWAPVTIEVIKDVKELDNTDLTYTPIIITINASLVPRLQGIMRYFKDRTDVVVQQVFFKLTDGLNEEIIYRVIKDLGINTPHIIKSFDDDGLKKYFELYPQTDYIADSITMFHQKSDEVQAELDKEKAEGEQSNTETDEQLQAIDNAIDALHIADGEITTRNHIDKPVAFTNADNKFTGRITNWRKKKTKIVQQEAAEAMAKELYHETVEGLDEFITSINTAISDAKDSIDQSYKTIYDASGYDDDFSVEKTDLKDLSALSLDDFQQNLLNIKQEEKVSKVGVGLFYLANNNMEDYYEMQTSYYLQKWREYVFSVIIPMIQAYMEEGLKLLNDYNNHITDAYHEHLMKAIDKENSEKAVLSKQLSHEEKLLQQDSAWLTDFKQQLKAIERG